ncbi:choline-phosphate cytidylyltransferase, partial [Elasticomyces elasticus]
MPPKRKRGASPAGKIAAAEPVQPSSQDASGEETTDPILEAVKQRKSTDAPSKRMRSARSGNGVSSKGGDESSEDEEMNGDGVDEQDEDVGGENGEAEQMKMDAPPKAGLVDPVGGYHTNPPPTGRPVRVYADGVFDLFHLGHMRQLEQAKTAFPNTYLLVGVTGDSETHRRKGLTVLSAKERAETVRHCKWVDEVVEDCPWIVTMDFLEKHKIDYVAHDDIPYGADEGDDIYKPVKERGMFLVTQRTEGVSTTGIITKIVRDYEQYIARQLKRGTTRQELNISWLKKNELDIKRHVAELRDSVRTNWATTG